MRGVELTEPQTEAGRAGLARLLADPAHAVLAVDFDGTLAPIVARPEDARPADGAVATLRALSGRLGRCVVVSGRAVDDVVRFAALADSDAIEVHGHYGLETWARGQVSGPAPAPAIGEARRRLPAVLADAPAGVHIEDKGRSLVVHTRPAADPAEALLRVSPRVQALAAELGLETVPGRMVVEVRPPGIDKGTAVRRVATEAEATSVTYVGDDLGDLPAFDAVEELRHTGCAGLTVASADPDVPDSPPLLAERADLVLPGPRAVVGWLRALAAALGA